jgi:chromosome segregation ATPase
MSEKLEQLSMEVSKRDRNILSLENAKEGLKSQLEGKDKANEELRTDFQTEKVQLHQKIEELKQKYENSMDELTQSRINFEREKALKDQRLQFQEQRLTEYHDQMNQTIERYEERLKQEKDDNQKTLTERIARIQQEKENVETKYEQKRKALKETRPFRLKSMRTLRDPRMSYLRRTSKRMPSFRSRTTSSTRL